MNARSEDNGLRGTETDEVASLVSLEANVDRRVDSVVGCATSSAVTPGSRLVGAGLEAIAAPDVAINSVTLDAAAAGCGVGGVADTAAVGSGNEVASTIGVILGWEAAETGGDS